MKIAVTNFERTYDMRTNCDAVTIHGFMSPTDAQHAYNELAVCNELDVRGVESMNTPKRSVPRVNLTYNGVCDVEKVIFNGPATIVIWADGTKTVVRCQEGDTFDKEKGLALCFMKKALENKSGTFNKVLDKWVGDECSDIHSDGVHK